MKKILRITISLLLFIVILLGDIKLSTVEAFTPDTITVTADEETRKQISSSMINVTMDHFGNYGLMLIPNIPVFYYKEVSTTSTILVKIGNSVTQFRDLSLERFEIIDNKIVMTRVRANSVRVKVTLSIVNATDVGGFMKVEVETENLAPQPQEIGVMIYWDTMLGGNDSSPFQIIKNGWRNYNDSELTTMQVSAFFKDTMHVTYADSIWMGQWTSSLNLEWDTKEEMSWEEHVTRIGDYVTTTDTAAAGWYNPTSLSQGESKTISTIIGVGPINTPPVLGQTNLSELQGRTFFYGESIQLYGRVTDEDDFANEGYLMLSIDGQEAINVGQINMSATGTEFDYGFYIPDNLSEGAHTLQIYIVDVYGGTSSYQQISVNIKARLETEQRVVQADAIVNITPKAPDSGTTVWLAPEGTTSFSQGSNMTVLEGDGTTQQIVAPSEEGIYRLFELDENGIIVAISSQTLIVDNRAPNIALRGGAEVTVEQGQLYVDPGMYATDILGDDISGKVEIEGFVNTDKLGSYTLTYKAIGSNGIEVKIQRVVNVVKKVLAENATIDASNKESITDSKLSNAIQSASSSTNKIVNIKVTGEVNIENPVIVTISKRQAELAQESNVQLILEASNASIAIPIDALDTSLLSGNERLALVIEQVDINLPQHADIVNAVSNINSTIEIYDGKIFDFTMKKVTEDETGIILSEEKIENFQSTEDIKLSIFVGKDLNGQVLSFMTFYYNPVSTAWEYIRSSYDSTGGNIDLLTNHLSIYSVMNMTKSEKQEEMTKLLNKSGITIQEVINIIEDTDMDFNSDAVAKYNTLTKKHIEAIVQSILDQKPLSGYDYATLKSTYQNVVNDKLNLIGLDTIAPQIQLNGDSEIILYQYQNYNEQGVTATDNQDGNITGRVISQGIVDTSRVGSYTLKYTVSDLNGNTTIVYRTVKIISRTIELSEDKEELEDKESDIKIIEGQNNLQVIRNVTHEETELPLSNLRLIGSIYNVNSSHSDTKGNGVIQIKYDVTQVRNINNIGVYLYDEVTKAWILLAATINKINHYLEVNVTAPSVIAVMEKTITFKDMDNHWAKDTANYLADRGIFIGDTNGNFNPYIGITRAEFATIVSRVLELPVNDVSSEFNDVTKNDWYSPYIAAARKAGVVKGVSEIEYEPQRIVTREEMTAIVVRAYTYSKGLFDLQLDANETDKFADSVSISEWAYENVYTAKQLKLVQGRQNNEFAPKSNTLRGEAAALIYQLIQALNKI